MPSFPAGSPRERQPELSRARQSKTAPPQGVRSQPATATEMHRTASEHAVRNDRPHAEATERIAAATAATAINRTVSTCASTEPVAAAMNPSPS